MSPRVFGANGPTPERYTRRVFGTISSRAAAAARKRGFHVERAIHGISATRAELLMRNQTDLVVDVGAAEGQYLRELRLNSGCLLPVLCIEPRVKSFALLRSNSRDDQRASMLNCAIGSQPGAALLHLTASAHASSIRRPIPAVSTTVGPTTRVGEEEVKIRRLDEIEDIGAFERIHLKVDVQGFEDEVLASAAGILPKICTIEMELSLVALYDGQPLIEDMIARLRSLGFHPMLLARGYRSEVTGDLLQMDGLFERSDGSVR
jgi:FkbM family methyltransferase